MQGDKPQMNTDEHRLKKAIRSPSVFIGVHLWLLFLTSFAWSAPAEKGRMVIEATEIARHAPEAPPGWRAAAQRDEIRPKAWVDTAVSRSGHGSLALAGAGNAAACGQWEATAPVQAGKWYRLTASYRCSEVPFPRQSVYARLDWRNGDDRAGQPDYVAGGRPEEEWYHLDRTVQAPVGATRVRLELCFAWARDGTAWWDEIALAEAPPPPPRWVRLTTIFHRPRGLSSVAANVESFCQVIDRAAAERPDLICLPEGMTMVGTGLSYVAAAEPVPGPTTRRLGEKAREHHAYVVAGLLERDGAAVYNTSVLIDRTGRLAGKYRKVYLPREEVDGGLTPGNDFPVFDTDFGRVGMMICWDVQYADPARALAVRGAEVILLPIWGGIETLASARAIENQVYLVTSSYDMPTGVINPLGEWIARATPEKAWATAEIDLNRRIVQDWLGDMKARFQKERRADIVVPELNR
jgi:predicted amidohydrolase